MLKIKWHGTVGRGFVSRCEKEGSKHEMFLSWVWTKVKEINLLLVWLMNSGFGHSIGCVNKPLSKKKWKELDSQSLLASLESTRTAFNVSSPFAISTVLTAGWTWFFSTPYNSHLLAVTQWNLIISALCEPITGQNYLLNWETWPIYFLLKHK